MATVPLVTEVWTLPGYDVQALIGFGVTGEVWRARELATGHTVALKRLRDDADPVAVAALRREAPVLRSLDTPYVVRLRAVLGDDAETVLVLDHAAGGSLAALLARRGTLDPAEVITVAAPLAQALAAAHACGLVHGAVTPANVLFSADGMPLLADLGLARLGGPSADDECDEAGDVWALAALCHQMLSGAPPDAVVGEARAPLALLAPTAPRALVTAIEQALQADVALRPDAAAFAKAVRRSHAAAPVRLTEGDPAPTTQPPPAPVAVAEPVAAAGGTAADERSHRRLLAVGAAGALVVAAAAAGWMTGRTGPVELATVEAATPAPAASTAPSWPVILSSLDEARAKAFAAADPAALAGVYAPTSPLLRADRAAIARLRAEGRRARGVRHRFTTAAVTAQHDLTVVLRVVDELAAYEVVDAAGRVVSRTAPRSKAAFRVQLVRTAAGWRLSAITPL